MSIIGLVNTDTGSQHPYEPGTTDNILINTNGKNMVNQREATTVAHNSYGFDRWRMNSRDSIARVISQESGSARLTITDKGTAISGVFYQDIENHTLYRGKTLTLSVRMRATNGSIIYIADVPGQASIAYYTTPGEWQTLNVTYTIQSNSVYVRSACHANVFNDGDYVEFEWIKLEEGDHATPYVIPDPALELARCQRYFQAYGGSAATLPISNSYNLNTTQARGVFHFVETMRTAPSISISNAAHFSINHQDTNVAATNLAFNDIYKDAAYITATASGLTAGQGSAILATSTDARIFLNAEI